MKIQDSLEYNDQWIDRLVDGELSDDERRALLAKLDAEPDSGGWRLCALAFLEAQTWREAFAPVAAPAVPCPSPVFAARKSPRLAMLRMPAALAASMLLAFSVGWFSRGEASPRVARVDPAPSHSSPHSIPKSALATAEKSAPASSVPAPAPTTVAQEQENSAPPPNPIVSRLESRGFQIDRRERVVAVETRDGRRMAVPVAEVRLRYVGDRTY